MDREGGRDRMAGAKGAGDAEVGVLATDAMMSLDAVCFEILLDKRRDGLINGASEDELRVG